MIYDFSNYFKENNEDILSEFIDKYTTLLNIDDNETYQLIEKYKAIINTFSGSFDEDKILELFDNLAKHEVLLEHPYVIITNEIHCLQNLLTGKIVSVDNDAKIFDFLKLFNKINNRVADIYLNRYINQLLSLNTIRINSISELVNKNLIKHYGAHLIWLNNIAKYIQNHKANPIPELSEHKCDFGEWLYHDAKNIVKNNSKLKSIISIHTNLHIFAEKIQMHIDKDEQHILITYLEKCELLSLSIGTELALIDNILMNKIVTKDELTGAMNRNSLENIFRSQYDLSLATGNSFILAMCDLDFFKNVNDTYGHVSGDKLLKLFVDVCKHHLRNSDIIIRYGGEEFIIILPAVLKAKGNDVLEKIRQEFQESFSIIDDKKVSTTVSIGFVEIKPEQYYKECLLNEYVSMADQKLYLAKENGRNRIEVC